METWKPEEIKSLRKGLRLSQVDFAARIGVTGNYVWMLEKGVKTPSDTLCLLLDYIEREKEKERKVKGGKGNL